MPAGDSDRGELRLSLSTSDIVGAAVERVLPIVRFLSHISAPNELQIRPAVGNIVISRSLIGQDLDYVSGEGLQHLEDLALLRTYAEEVNAVPSQVEPKFANELHEYARMLRGEILSGTWDVVDAVLNVPRPRLAPLLRDAGALMVVSHDVSLATDAETISLGWFSTVFALAVLGPEQPNDPMNAKLVPAGDTTFTRSFAPNGPP